MTNNLSMASASDIRDIKPPLDIPSEWAPLWTLALVAAAIIAAIFLWYWWRNRKTHVVLPPPTPPHILARQRLAEALELLAQPKPFCIMVSDIVRLYLEKRFNFHAPERTTEEFLRELSGSNLLLSDQKESVAKFLESCDLVKFAKYEPGETELRGLHGSALQLVEETQPSPAPAEPASAGHSQ